MHYGSTAGRGSGIFRCFIPGAILALLVLFTLPVLPHDDDDELEVEGVIQALGSDYLMVNDYTLYVNNETEIHGPDGDIDFSDLQVGQFVEVEAELQPDSTYLATEIEVEDDIEVEGPIESIGPDSLVVQSVVFYVDSTTEVRGHEDHDSLTFDDLEVGDYVEVHGYLQPDGRYKASRIELEDPHSKIKVRGRIQAIDSSSVMVKNQVFLVDSTTRIEAPHDKHIHLSDLLVGDSVEVKAMLLPDSSLFATRIKLKKEHTDTTFEGRITALGDHSVSVNGISAIVNAATRIRDMHEEDIPFSSLSVGDSVHIRIAVRPDSSLLATRIIVREFSSFTGIPENDLSNQSLAKHFKLGQNFPNPFNPSTTVPVTVTSPQWQKVDLVVFNLVGQQVRTLFNGQLNEGTYSFVWDGKTDKGELVPSGIYFYQLKVGNQVVKTRRMLLVK